MLRIVVLILSICACLISSSHAQDRVELAARIGANVALYKDLRNADRFDEAVKPIEELVTLAEQLWGEGHPEVGNALGQLAAAYDAVGRTAEAEQALLKELEIRERTVGPDHPDTGTVINNLANIYDNTGRKDQAWAMYQRAYETLARSKNPDPESMTTALATYGNHYYDEGRYDLAEQYHLKALTLAKKGLGAGNEDVATCMNNLAYDYIAQHRFAEAEKLVKGAMQIDVKRWGHKSSNYYSDLESLANIYFEQGRWNEAEEVNLESLAFYKKHLGDLHPATGGTYDDLAKIYAAQADWSRAVDSWRRAANVVVRRTKLSSLDGASPIRQGPSTTGRTEVQKSSDTFTSLVQSLHRLAVARQGGDELPEAFRAAQWALTSDVAASLAQMAARGASKNPELAQVVRERQDLIAEWNWRDRIRASNLGKERSQRDDAADTSNRQRLDVIEQRVQEIDQRIKDDFAEYAAIASPTPSTLADVTSVLRQDEALVFLFVTQEVKPLPEETYVWIATKSSIKWYRVDLGAKALQREVAALRCGLDFGENWQASNASCPSLTGENYNERDSANGKALPFDLSRAHSLYDALFGQAEDIIKGKSLLIVATGALSQLPFQVLLTQPPDTSLNNTEIWRRAAWLLREHTITMLPSVASLRLLRDSVQPTRAQKALVGFGNPLLNGSSSSDTARARKAEANSTCPIKIPSVVLSYRGVSPPSMRSGMADAEIIRSAPPLPETADELCAVAKDLNVGNDDIYLGARATVAQVVRMSEAGELQKYRILHFATHGALAGQVGRYTEPGLILTPPIAANSMDDGYLSASKVAALKLDADWVILSACNTAAGAAEGAEALSGLARAFFYAGARSLLVSHWSVNSNATVKLITGALTRLRDGDKIGRADALRLSMLDMIERGTELETRPSMWAPFIVVGDGGGVKAH
jgi:CHAT domain-containing protein/tetratricopeptide (TPR) repeat protein